MKTTKTKVTNKKSTKASINKVRCNQPEELDLYSRYGSSSIERVTAEDEQAALLCLAGEYKTTCMFD